MVQNNSDYWGAEDSGDESLAPKKEKTTKVEAKRVPEKKAEKKDEMQPGPDEGVSKIFPKIGEKVEDFDRRSGDIKLTQLQLPAMANWIPGKPYKLVVDVVMKESEYEQDSEYKEGYGRISTSEPYLCGRFEITNIEEAADEPDADAEDEEK